MSFKNTLKGLLKVVAPTLATAVGGPMGGIAMKFLADKFTDGDTGSVEDFLLASDPETLKQLKVAELDFQREMKSLDIDLEKIAGEDRKSARDLAREKGFTPQIVLSVAYTLGYFGVLFMFMSGNITIAAEHEVMFGGLLGILSTAQVQIMNFWFGSSAGSKRKTEALARNRN